MNTEKISLTAPASSSAEQHFATDHLLPELKRRTISSGVITTIAQGAQFVLNLGSTMVLARLLMPQDFGLVAMVVTVTGFLHVFKDAGLSTATVQREGITHAQVSNLFWINVALGGAMALLLAAAAPLIAWFFHEPRLIGITLALSITFLLNGSTVQHMALLNRQMRFRAVSMIEVGSTLAGVAAGIAMAILGFGYWALVGASVTVPAVRAISTWSVSRWRPQLPKRCDGTMSLLGFGANLTAGGFMYSLARGSDNLFIGRLFGADGLGLYSRAAALLIRPLEQFIIPIYVVLMPALSRLQNQPERYRRSFLELFEVLALAGFILAGLLFALATPLTLVVLGPKWGDAAVIFAGFSIAAVFIPLCTAATWLFSTQGRGKEWLRASATLSCVTVASFVAGLPFGPAGVAVAYALGGVFVQLPLLYWMAGQRGPVSSGALWMACLRHLPVWAVVAGGAWLALQIPGLSSPLAQLAVAAPAGILAGALFVWAFAPARQIAVRLFGLIRELKRVE